MELRALCLKRACHLARSGVFQDIARLKHQLQTEGFDTRYLSDRGLARALALPHVYLLRMRSTHAATASG